MKERLENRDIIVVGLQPFDMAIGSNCINIALQFAKYNRVLYVNYPLDTKTIKKEKNKDFVKKRIEYLKGRKENLIKIYDKLYNLYPATKIYSINWIPFTFLFSIFNFINNYKYSIEIKKAIKKLGFKDYIIFNDSDMFRSYYLKNLLNPSLYIYYSRDNLMSVAYWYKHGKILEPKLMQKSDLVCANSVYLKNIASQFNKHAYYVGQGCDVDAFNPNLSYSIPNDLKNLNKPVIGYIGALYSLRLDIEIIEHIAYKFKECSIVLIGPQDEIFKNSALHKMSNVVFLGHKKPEELPTYLNYFDVAINPQAINPTTIGNYPRKIDEYLAMGKPVVATNTEAMSIFKGYVYLCNNKDEYIENIILALNQNDDELKKQRIAFAQSHTWENSVAEIYNAIKKVKPNLFN
ncbi:MAG: glycosyltransferase [Bacteroidia bacterium]